MYGHIYTRHNTTKKNCHVMIKTKKEKNNIYQTKDSKKYLKSSRKSIIKS